MLFNSVYYLSKNVTFSRNRKPKRHVMSKLPWVNLCAWSVIIIMLMLVLLVVLVLFCYVVAVVKLLLLLRCCFAVASLLLRCCFVGVIAAGVFFDWLCHPILFLFNNLTFSRNGNPKDTTYPKGLFKTLRRT